MNATQAKQRQSSGLQGPARQPHPSSVRKARFALSAGFTIYELMITTAIVGIVAAMAIPAMGRFFERNKVTTQTNDLVMALTLARSEAINRGQDTRVVPMGGVGNDWNTGWQVEAGTGTDPTLPFATSELVRVFDTAGGTSVIDNANAPGSVQFRYSGELRATATPNFELTPSDCPTGTDWVRDLIVMRAGHVRLTYEACP